MLFSFLFRFCPPCGRRPLRSSPSSKTRPTTSPSDNHQTASQPLERRPQFEKHSCRIFEMVSFMWLKASETVLRWRRNLNLFTTKVKVNIILLITISQRNGELLTLFLKSKNKYLSKSVHHSVRLCLLLKIWQFLLQKSVKIKTSTERQRNLMIFILGVADERGFLYMKKIQNQSTVAAAAEFKSKIHIHLTGGSSSFSGDVARSIIFFRYVLAVRVNFTWPPINQFLPRE